MDIEDEPETESESEYRDKERNAGDDSYYDRGYCNRAVAALEMRNFEEVAALEIECERWIGDIWKEMKAMQTNQSWFLKRIKTLEAQVANLEARKPPQDTNPDPEWYP